MPAVSLVLDSSVTLAWVYSAETTEEISWWAFYRISGTIRKGPPQRAARVDCHLNENSIDWCAGASGQPLPWF